MLITLDFETYFKTGKDSYSLRSLPLLDYVADPRFEVIMCGVKEDDKPTEIIRPRDLPDAFNHYFGSGNTNTLLCHNTMFDGLILDYRYGVHPSRYADTLSMFSALANYMSHSLESMSEALFPNDESKRKTKELHNFAGYRYKDFNQNEFDIFSNYCRNDVDLTYDCYRVMQQFFPESELDIIHHSLRLFIEPIFRLDTGRVETSLKSILEEKKALALRAREEHGITQKIMGSNPQFAKWLEERDIPVPMKLSTAKKSKGKPTFAFAKDDLQFMALQREYPEYQSVWDARIAEKSTAEVTRHQRFLNNAAKDHGQMRVALKYHSAHTGRYGGGEKCLAGGTRVLTQTGWKPIELVKKSDRVWDGAAWVSHQGAALIGVKEVIDLNGVKMTPDHKVLTTKGWKNASSCEGHYRAESRLPDSYRIRWQRWEEIPMAGQVRMRRGEDPSSHRAKENERSRLPIILRMQNQKRQYRPSTIFHLAGDVEALSFPILKGVPPIRRERDSSLPPLAGRFSSFSGGHGTDLSFRPDARSNRQRRRILPRKLSMGIHENPRKKPSQQCAHRGENTLGTRERKWTRNRNNSIPSPCWMALRVANHPPARETEVYDLIDCGPKNRFVVQDSEGLPLIVHNCNMQNLGRGSELRRALCAPDNHRVYVADLSQIEARVNAWLSGENELVDDFRKGIDIYSKFASTLLGRHVDRKANPEDKVAGQLGKVCILGLGYQMGAAKFKDTLAKGPMGADPIIVDEITAKKYVNTYRATYKHIAYNWDIAQRHIHGMCQPDYDAMWGPARVMFQRIILPNGLCLNYPHLEAHETDRGYQFQYWNGKFMKNLYGGSAVENLTQALAFVIIKEQLRSVIRHMPEMRYALQVHDENIFIGPETNADARMEKILQLMSTPPEWAYDLPVAAEGGHDVNYSK